MPLLILLPLAILAIVALIPIALVQRYRRGVARQRARGWLISINLVGLALSIMIFVLSAAVTSIWLHPALAYTLAGLGIGFALGIVGLCVTRWEPTRDGIYYTPNRWLILTITLVVSGRVLYGFWRAWDTWRAGLEDASWIGAAGVAKSMAAGAIVLGYYFIYWIGVRRRLRHQQQAIAGARR